MSLSTSPFRKTDLAGAMQQDLPLLRTLKDDHGRTLLTLLCLDDLVSHSLICELAPSLAASEADFACDATGSSALHVAVRQRPADVSGAIARASSAVVRDTRDMHSRTALHLAVLANKADHVQQLLEAGCNPNILSAGITGGTALHWAASTGHVEIISLLLLHCDPLLLNEAGVTAAALSKSEGCRELLLAAEQDRKQRDEVASLRAGSVKVPHAVVPPLASGVKKKLTIKVNPK
jgi:ankyrin repeat protein